jgi:hypothetical protein
MCCEAIETERRSRIMGGKAFTYMAELGTEYQNFVAIFTWPPEDDQKARERFKKILPLYPAPQNAPVVPGAAYSLTGARTVLVIGRSNSESELYAFCSSIIFDSGIEANFYHCVNFGEARDYLSNIQP